MAGIEPELIRHQVRMACQYIGLWSEDAEELLMLTCVAETDLLHVVQLGGGPARGWFQMEPATEQSIFEHYLNYPSRKALKALVLKLRDLTPASRDPLRDNPAYAAALARIKYRRIPKPLASKEDVLGMAKYHKRYYNTNLGKAVVLESVKKYNRYILGKEVEA